MCKDSKMTRKKHKMAKLLLTDGCKTLKRMLTDMLIHPIPPKHTQTAMSVFDKSLPLYLFGILPRCLLMGHEVVLAAFPIPNTLLHPRLPNTHCALLRKRT